MSRKLRPDCASCQRASREAMTALADIIDHITVVRDDGDNILFGFTADSVLHERLCIWDTEDEDREEDDPQDDDVDREY